MLKNQIISLVGLGKMGLGIYNRLYNKNINIHGYDINHDIIKNNTHINFLEIENKSESLVKRYSPFLSDVSAPEI